MNYVFFGTPQFAAIVLGQLAECGFVPAALVANPDRPVGRKKIITPPPTKQLVSTQGWKTELLQPERASEILPRLKDLRPDLFIVAAYARIIPASLLAIPRLGTIGVHPSLLPRHRGATPIQNTILAGDHETGVTLYVMDAKVDHGPILSRVTCHVSPSDTYETLITKLAELGGKLLCETLTKFAEGKVTPIAQDEAQATYTAKFGPDDGFIPWETLTAAMRDGAGVEEISKKIRALNPEPGAYTREPSGTRMKLLQAVIMSGKLSLTLTQREGERPKPR